jgi:glucose/arabinose dehydrogenase
MRPKVILFGGALLLLSCMAGCGGSAENGSGEVDAAAAGYQVEVVADGLNRPWGMAFLPDGRLLVTERSGRLNLLDPATGARTPVSGVPAVKAVGQGGLLDVVLHPEFSSNHWVYLSFSAGEGGLSTHLGRGRLQGEALTEFQLLFQATAAGEGGEHFGGRLLFDRGGYLFLGLGDRHQRNRAQDLSDHNGSLIRLRDDGLAPVDNPFLGRADALDEIYTYGHRNIQGLALHPETGELWISEHGPQGGDEINLIAAGRNYGWPLITYGEEYGGGKIGETHREGMEQPIRHWTPAIAPAGAMFYSGDAFPAWKGDLFVGSLVGKKLVRLSLNSNRVVAEESLLAGQGHRIRDVGQGPDGFLYVLVDADNAPLLRLRPAP